MGEQSNNASREGEINLMEGINVAPGTIHCYVVAEEQALRECGVSNYCAMSWVRRQTVQVKGER